MVRIRSVPSFSFFFPHSSLNSYIKILFLPCFIVTSVGKEPFYQKINNNYENYWDIFSLRSTGYNWNKIFSSSVSVFIFPCICLIASTACPCTLRHPNLHLAGKVFLL